MQHWRIELFGGLCVRCGEHAITRFRSQKTGALLGYLAYYPGRMHPRELLVEALWPGSEPGLGRGSLSTALWSLRRQLEPPGVPLGAMILADRTSVGLNACAVSTDVADFLAAVEAARAAPEPARREHLIRAAELYQGELLAGYYEDWIAPEQRRLAARFRDALARLIPILEGAGELRQAIAYAIRAVEADALCEDSHRELIRLYIAAGQPDRARRQYAVLEATLARELGVAPSEPTRALLQRAAPGSRLGAYLPRRVRPMPPATDSPARAGAAAGRAGEAAGAPPQVRAERSRGGGMPPALTRFVGREAEIEQLGRLLTAGTARLVTVLGPSGMGKTRLAIEAGRRLLDALDGRVWFVPLAEVADSQLVPDAACRVVCPQRRPEEGALEALLLALSGPAALLILDNAEHVLPGTGSLAMDILGQAPGVRCLVTSRQKLGTQGEHLFPLAPLPVPRGRSSPGELLACPSVALFVDRAQAVVPDFQVTRANGAAIARLCAGLEGIPLSL